MFQIIYVHDIFEGLDDPILPDTGGSVLEELYPVIHRRSSSMSLFRIVYNIKYSV